jgi:hypothetical protein
VVLNSYSIDAYNSQLTDLRDVRIPSNKSCDGITTVKGRYVIAPSTSNTLGLGISMDSIHGSSVFYADDKIVNGSKFYVANGCAAYSTYGKMHQTSFCYILEYGAAVQLQQQPNIVISFVGQAKNSVGGDTTPIVTPAAPPVPPILQTPAPKTVMAFAACASGFESN